MIEFAVIDFHFPRSQKDTRRKFNFGNAIGFRIIIIIIIINKRPCPAILGYFGDQHGLFIILNSVEDERFRPTGPLFQRIPQTPKLIWSITSIIIPGFTLILGAVGRLTINQG